MYDVDTVKLIQNSEAAISFLKRLGYSPYFNKNMVKNIQDCKDWYQGYIRSVHNVSVYDGLTVTRHELYRLNMAKRVCEDWVSTLLSEDIKITVADTNKKASVFLQGSKGVGGVLGSTNFWERFEKNLEKMLAFGTSAIAIDIENGVLHPETGAITRAEDTKIGYSFYTADSIIPLKWREDKITDCAFITQYKKKESIRYKVRIDTKENGVSNIYIFDTDSTFGEKKLDLHIQLPDVDNTFVILATTFSNNVDLRSPMGISVYGNDFSVLKAVDTAYDQCMNEVVSGRRIVMMDKSMLGKDANGNPVVPQEARQSYMQYVGDPNFVSEEGYKVPAYDFCPTLRVDALDKELQNQLNILSEKCGLGSKYYSFDMKAGVTATEYTGSTQDYQRNAKKLSSSLARELKQLMLDTIQVGVYLGFLRQSNPIVTVEVPDGIITDDSSEREQDRQDVQDGLMSKAEYRMKWYGETQAEAEEALSKIANPGVQIAGNI